MFVRAGGEAGRPPVQVHILPACSFEVTTNPPVEPAPLLPGSAGGSADQSWPRRAGGARAAQPGLLSAVMVCPWHTLAHPSVLLLHYW